MPKQNARTSTLSFPCPTCGAQPWVRCISLKPGAMSRRDYERMIETEGEMRLIKSHGSRRMLAQQPKARAPKPR